MNARHILGAGMLVMFAPLGAQETLNAPEPFTDVPGDACSDGKNKTPCVIELEVADKDADNCEISFVYPWADLVAFEAGIKDKFIYWKIVKQPAGNRYRFTTDGIAFTNDFPPRNFVAGNRGNSLTSFRWKNRFKRLSVYKYTISVTDETEKSAPKRECFLDPWIRNRA